MSRTWQDWLNVAAGVWLIASPWVLGFAVNATALLTFVVLGVLIGGAALFARTRAASTEWLVAFLGVFTYFSPWIFSFGLSAARWNAWIVGALVALVALWAFFGDRETTGQRATG